MILSVIKLSGYYIVTAIYFIFKFSRIEKNKNKIWIVIWIDDKDDYEWFKLKKDFIDSIEENLDKTKFKVIILSKKYLGKIYKSKWVVDKEFISKINKKIKWHYFIVWKAQKWKEGKLKCYLETNALVFHKDIPENIKNELSEDFSNLYSNHIYFEDDWYKSWIDFSGEYNSIIAKYIIWVSLLISNDPFWALKLHRWLNLDLDKIKKQKEVKSSFNESYIKKISEKIKIIQYRELHLISRYFYRIKNYIDGENI